MWNELYFINTNVVITCVQSHVATFYANKTCLFLNHMTLVKHLEISQSYVHDMKQTYYNTVIFSDLKKETLTERKLEGRSSESSHRHKRRIHSHQAFTPKVGAI